jgi:DNA-directed RNA polymerase subunit RPC12/RpoP
MIVSERRQNMPKFVCRKCAREFWGWGVNHMYRAGKHLVCPDCEGALVEKKEKLAVPDLKDGFFDGPEAA